MISVNPHVSAGDIEVGIAHHVDSSMEAQADEQWSYVGRKQNQRWLWHAIDVSTGVVLAFVFGKRTEAVCQSLMDKLAPFDIKRYYTDDWGSYRKLIPPDKHIVGKQYTQKIENKNLLFRTRIKRLARKTICFSKSEKLHDGVIGMFINRYCFQLN